jgi:3-oxoacyl-[acyl-carrier protein] reductase
MFDLSDKTAWVTGSAQNLGKAMVDDLATQGANVVVSNRTNTEKLEKTIEELQEKHDSAVYGVQLDITNEEAVADAVEEIHRNVGSVDVMVNNAAHRPHQAIDDITLEDWNHVLETNLTGAFLCTRAVIPDMIEQGWGRIISISGIDAYFGKPQRLHVVSTKAGIIGFSRALAQELAEHGITSNCVSPGVFRTDRPDDWHPNPEIRYQGIRDRTPLQRLGRPEGLSPMIVFLASEESRYVTGQELLVNGGLFPTTRDPTELDLDELLPDSGTN